MKLNLMKLDVQSINSGVSIKLIQIDMLNKLVIELQNLIVEEPDGEAPSRACGLNRYEVPPFERPSSVLANLDKSMFFQEFLMVVHILCTELSIFLSGTARFRSYIYFEMYLADLIAVPLFVSSTCDGCELRSGRSFARGICEEIVSDHLRPSLRGNTQISVNSSTCICRFVYC